MAVLKPNEYDISYFDGKKASLQHNAGYTSYDRWPRINNDFVPHDQSLGEYWKDLALRLKIDYSLEGKKVLEIGAAKGFVVEGLRDLGVNAYGIDISQYAIDCAREDIKPYLKVADIRTALSTYKNKEFDLVFSRLTLNCFTDAEIAQIVTQINRISLLQAHWIMETGNATYYNLKTAQQWKDSFNWQKGTIFIKGNFSEVIKK